VSGIASVRHNADATVQRLDFVPLAMGCVLGVFAKGTAPVCSFREQRFFLPLAPSVWTDCLTAVLAVL